jgi:hypothetical protein
MTPAAGKDWALAWGCNAYVKELPYANAAYNYDFKPGESGRLTLEFWITPFDYAGCEGPRRAVESVLSENKLIGLAWAILDYDDARSEKHSFWNLSRQHTMYGKADELVAFRLMPLEPQFRKFEEFRRRDQFGGAESGPSIWEKRRLHGDAGSGGSRGQVKPGKDMGRSGEITRRKRDRVIKLTF